MKLTYLGTAAAEGFPAVFCNCAHCREARRLGGKNIRTRCQALLGDDLLIDLPADTYHHFLTNGIAGDKIKHLLITHSHLDHFYPGELQLRHGAFSHDMRAPTLEILCGEGAYNTLMNFRGMPVNVSAGILPLFTPTVLGNYTVTALPARHMPGDDARTYIIEGDGRLLWAHDTGYLHREALDYIEISGLCFDLISYDCTNVDIPISDDGTHMGIPNILRLDEALTRMGAADRHTVRVINHFSHNAVPLQEKLEERVAPMGWLVAYDGMSIEFVTPAKE